MIGKYLDTVLVWGIFALLILLAIGGITGHVTILECERTVPGDWSTNHCQPLEGE